MSNNRSVYLTADTKCRVKEAFRLMDADADGYLDYYETKAAMKAMGLTVKKSFIVSIMHMYDKHDNSRITFDDFYYVVSNKLKKQNLLDEIKHVFKFFTVDALSSKITLEDLKRINEQIECNLTIDEMEAMIKEFDTNQDGSSKIIDLSEITNKL